MSNSAPDNLPNPLETTRSARARVALLLFWSYAVLWTVLLIVPDPGRILFLPRGIPQQLERAELPWDKIIHAGGYAVLMIAALATLTSGPRAWGTGWLFFAGVLHSALTELIQLAVPKRRGDWADLVVDIAGLCLGLVVWWGVGKVRWRGWV